MRHSFPALMVLCCFCVSARPQLPESDDRLMAKARAAYDAPFMRNLAAFDCAVQFDWKQHFTEMLGTLPSEATSTAEKLQTIHHRVSVDHTQAVVSSTPKRPDFSGTQHETQLQQLEKVLIAMVSSGLNAWLPSSTNGVLPSGNTQYSFEKLSPGYKLTTKGENTAETLLLGPDFRVTSGTMQLPQQMRFWTDFQPGPDGFVLASVKTDSASTGEAGFAFTYQVVDGEQIPAVVTVTPATTGKWEYRLTDCKVVKFAKVQGLPRQ